MAYNLVVLEGRLTKDPELRYIPSGQPVASFTLAVDRSYVQEGKERETDFVDIIAWRKLAETVSQHLQKGSYVLVQGRLQIRAYETQDGQKRKVTEIVATEIRFLGPKPKGATGESAAPSTHGINEDVPF
jgi:single-strand DNA-binding protein